MSAPKFFLISRASLKDHPERVAEALRITPPGATFAACDLDAKLALRIADPIAGLVQPWALVADFELPAGTMAIIDDQGHCVPVELPVVES